MPAQVHSFGFGAGAIKDFGDGTIGFITPLSFLPAAKARLADITGISSERTKKFPFTLHTMFIYGQGTMLATLDEVPSTYVKNVDEWIKKQKPAEAKSEAKQLGSMSSSNKDDFVERLKKLSDMHQAGALSEAEFLAAKNRIMSE